MGDSNIEIVMARGRTNVGDRKKAKIRLDLGPDILHLINKMSEKFLGQLTVRYRKRSGGTINN